MKFACENCGTRYTLSDEKVHNRLLKIRCKICENVIVVRDPRTSAAPSAAPAAEVEWFYVRAGGDPEGPMPEERLRDMVRQGKLAATDMVWSEVLAQWTAVSDVPALQPLLRVGGPPRLPPLPPALAARAGQAPPAPLQPRRKSAPPPAIDDDEERNTGTWTGRAVEEDRPTVSMTPDAALLQAAGAPVEHDTSLAPALPPSPLDDLSDDLSDDLDEESDPGSDLGHDTALAPALPPDPPAPSTAPLVAIPDAPSAMPAPPPPVVESVPPAPPEPPAAPDASSEVMRSSRELDALFFGDEKLALADEEAADDDDDDDAAAAPLAATPPGPPPPRSMLPIVLGGLLLLGGGLAAGILLGRGPAETPKDAAAVPARIADAAVPDAAPPVVDAAVPDAAPPVVDAAVPDAAPDAAPPTVAARPASRPRPPRPVAPPSAAPKTEAATGALAALDRGRVEAPVEKVEAPAEVEELPDTLEQRTISGVIKTNKRGVEGCYQRQLKRDPTMRQASIKLRFNIERTGQTSNVVLDEKYKGTELAACLERLVRRWRFPAFKGEAIPVEYPVLFHTSL